MDYFLGQILLVTFARVPDDSLPCDGRTLTIAQHQALFALLGARFGGDGVSTFKLPDLRPYTPLGMLYAIVTVGIFPTQE